VENKGPRRAKTTLKNTWGGHPTSHNIIIIESKTLTYVVPTDLCPKINNTEQMHNVSQMALGISGRK
jgi:hypothetical protein